MRITPTLTTILLLFCVSTSALAQDDPDPFDLYDEATENASRGRYSAAIDLYLEVADLTPDWIDVWYNLGEVSRVMEEYHDCAIFFRRYVLLAPDADDRSSVERTINDCEEEYEDPALLTITAEPAEATIYVNQVGLGEGLLESLPLPPDSYSIRIEADDWVPLEETISLGPAAEESLTFSLSRVVHYGTLQVNVNADGANIFIESELVGTSPLAEPISLVANERYLVQSRLAGYYDWVRRIEILPDEEYVLDIELHPLEE